MKAWKIGFGFTFGTFVVNVTESTSTEGSHEIFTSHWNLSSLPSTVWKVPSRKISYSWACAILWRLEYILETFLKHRELHERKEDEIMNKNYLHIDLDCSVDYCK